MVNVGICCVSKIRKGKLHSMLLLRTGRLWWLPSSCSIWTCTPPQLELGVVLILFTLLQDKVMLIINCLLLFEDLKINAINKAGETAFDIADKVGMPELASMLREAGGHTSKELGKPPNTKKQLKQTVSDIKHNVKSQLQQTHQTDVRVKKIANKLKKLHMNGLNNAINSATVVAVLIAAVAFAAIFQVPGQYVEQETPGVFLGQAEIGDKKVFTIFFVFDSISLFISLAVVVVQTSVVVIEQKAKKQLMFVINKLMWMACVCISIAFIALSYVVVGPHGRWLAIWATVTGAVIMIPTIGSMCYCVIRYRLEESKSRIINKAESRSRSYSMSVDASDPEFLSSEYKRMYSEKTKMSLIKYAG